MNVIITAHSPVNIAIGKPFGTCPVSIQLSDEYPKNLLGLFEFLSIQNPVFERIAHPKPGDWLGFCLISLNGNLIFGPDRNKTLIKDGDEVLLLGQYRGG